MNVHLMYLFYISCPILLRHLDGSRMWSSNSPANPGAPHIGMAAVCPTTHATPPTPSNLPCLQVLVLPQAHLGHSSVVRTLSVSPYRTTAPITFPCLTSSECNYSNVLATGCLKTSCSLQGLQTCGLFAVRSERCQGRQRSLKILPTPTNTN